MKPIRIGICALVTFTVLAHGAVEPWSEAVLEVGTGLLLAFWAYRVVVDATYRFKPNPLLWPLAGLWLVGALQLVTGFTAYSFLTRIELLKYSALLGLFFLFVQSYKTREHWHAFVWFLLTMGFAVSLFAILQHFTFNGKLYWFRELRYGGIPFGPYVNRNHFAGLMELIIPTGVATLVLGGERRDRLPLVALFSLLPIGALFLAASRGGIMSFLCEMGALVTFIFFRRRERKEIAAAGVVLILGIALVGWLGVGRALDRFASYKKLEVNEGRRVAMLRGSWKIFLDHPIAGTGLGTLQEVFPLYETMYDGLVVNHSHNDYAELLAETGVVGGLCGLGFLIILFSVGWKTLLKHRDGRNLAYHAGALIGCVGFLIHAFVDFNFHIPSNALIFLLQAAVVTSSAPPLRSSGLRCFRIGKPEHTVYRTRVPMRNMLRNKKQFAVTG